MTNHLISVKRPDLVIIKNKTRTCSLVDFAVLADHKVKFKEYVKENKYLALAGELKKKLWTMKVTIIPIVIISLGTLTKGFIQGLGMG